MSMQRTILTWGLISGAISGGLMLVAIPFTDKLGFERAEIFGYATLVLSALMIFFGLRSYRENVAAGALSFGRGVLVGLGIALIAAICYVAVWMFVYYTFYPDFYDKFALHMLDKAKSDGASAERLATVAAQADEIRKISGSPLLVVAMTFAENFPIGLVAAVLSAGILRRKPKTAAAA